MLRQSTGRDRDEPGNNLPAANCRAQLQDGSGFCLWVRRPVARWCGAKIPFLPRTGGQRSVGNDSKPEAAGPFPGGATQISARRDRNQGLSCGRGASRVRRSLGEDGTARFTVGIRLRRADQRPRTGDPENAGRKTANSSRAVRRFSRTAPGKPGALLSSRAQPRALWKTKQARKVEPAPPHDLGSETDTNGLVATFGWSDGTPMLRDGFLHARGFPRKGGSLRVCARPASLRMLSRPPASPQFSSSR